MSSVRISIPSDDDQAYYNWLNWARAQKHPAFAQYPDLSDKLDQALRNVVWKFGEPAPRPSMQPAWRRLTNIWCKGHGKQEAPSVVDCEVARLTNQGQVHDYLDKNLWDKGWDGVKCCDPSLTTAQKRVPTYNNFSTAQLFGAPPKIESNTVAQPSTAPLKVESNTAAQPSQTPVKVESNTAVQPSMIPPKTELTTVVQRSYFSEAGTESTVGLCPLTGLRAGIKSGSDIISFLQANFEPSVEEQRLATEKQGFAMASPKLSSTSQAAKTSVDMQKPAVPTSTQKPSFPAASNTTTGYFGSFGRAQSEWISSPSVGVQVSSQTPSFLRSTGIQSQGSSKSEAGQAPAQRQVPAAFSSEYKHSQANIPAPTTSAQASGLSFSKPTSKLFGNTNTQPTSGFLKPVMESKATTGCTVGLFGGNYQFDSSGGFGGFGSGESAKGPVTATASSTYVSLRPEAKPENSPGMATAPKETQQLKEVKKETDALAPTTEQRVKITVSDDEDENDEPAEPEKNDMAKSLSDDFAAKLRPILYEHIQGEIQAMSQAALKKIKQRTGSLLGRPKNAHFGYTTLRCVEIQTLGAMESEVQKVTNALLKQLGEVGKDIPLKIIKRYADELENGEIDQGREAKRRRTDAQDVAPKK